MMYEFLKFIHIATVILFVGTVFFRTFVVLKTLEAFPKNQAIKIQQAMGQKARDIIKINNLILIISGGLLLMVYIKTHLPILYLKVGMGLVLVIGFYFVPLLFNKLEANQRFKMIFHYLFFLFLMFIVLLSQFIYFDFKNFS
ncbi:hypothetical protein [Candidatus Marinarcus aquaticus]|uniref:DUF2269 family protein n=1 Tax=Candidatus Marinarcus aquaticus TaxID=2044504 RepID=A0A4Q0XQY0_9BACT|nr:hypothetical protein [Candidatus Marinarcus aquaticus]RXJ55268.1 hypothetical protein CRV04_10535 [Candidatus Marinarcus aquaticus]